VRQRVLPAFQGCACAAGCDDREPWRFGRRGLQSG